MTIQEIRKLIEKHNSGDWKHGELKELDAIIREYLKKQEEKTITREEEVSLWMYLRHFNYADADRWTAINRGEIKLGRQEDGSIID